MTETINLPFEVSARTARLIGRENIASSKGAIIELVKNAYDADSRICIVYFDVKIPSMKSQLTSSEFNSLLEVGLEREMILNVYFFNKNSKHYEIKSSLDDEVKDKYRKEISKYNSLFIIDSGEGMTQKIIRNNWMTIGTDNKVNDQKSKKGRIITGAKGIGRFALDKLGRVCEMTTIFNPEVHEVDTDIQDNKTNFTGYKWRVDWDDFEGNGKKINQVTAKLFGIESRTLRQEILAVLPDYIRQQFDFKEYFSSGTLLKISELREEWVDPYIKEVYSDLEVLVPPRENNEFKIYFFHSQSRNMYGEVEASVCDDYDYKLTAKVDKEQNVHIRIHRQEFDVGLIPPDFFARPRMLKSPFQKKDFINGYYEKITNLRKLVAGFNQVNEEALGSIGEFEFTFYFLKRNFSRKDAERFYYKRFQPNLRKDWLDKFGGIKLYRDNFRVRPYGEIRDSAFDWLSLGNRKATSPSGVAKGDNGYRVEPENIAGSIKISRLGNDFFQDKSSREGLQDNNVFQVFKTLLVQIINVFEVDRASIAREFAIYETFKNPYAKQEKLIDELRKELINQSIDFQAMVDNERTHLNPKQEDKYLILAYGLNHLIKGKEEEIIRLNNEQQILRGLASTGIVLASFRHDLNNFAGILTSRMDKLRGIIEAKINKDDYLNVLDRKNPFYLIQKAKEQDLKFQTWLNFSISATRKDKRKRKNIKLEQYFVELKKEWDMLLVERGIELILNIDSVVIKMFEIDLDSVFSNLFVNSIEAFNRLKENRDRVIKITVKNSFQSIIMEYNDNGSGLSPDLDDPEKIFEPLFTTKRNPFTAEEMGTGLGMWIVNSIIIENGGTTNLLFPKEGFGLRISIPHTKDTTNE